MFRRTLLVLLLSVPLSCASGGRSDSEMYPWGMRAFSWEKPPQCPYADVGRLAYEGAEPSQWQPAEFEQRAKVQQARKERKKQLLDAYYQLDADAFIEPPWRSGVTEFVFIRFADPDCTE